MATQLETLQLIADNLGKIWDKLCKVEELLNGGVIVDIPPFFNEFGDVLQDHQITLVDGDPDDPATAADMLALNDIYSQFTIALEVYSNRQNEPWVERPRD